MSTHGGLPGGRPRKPARSFKNQGGRGVRRRRPFCCHDKTNVFFLPLINVFLCPGPVSRVSIDSRLFLGCSFGFFLVARPARGARFV